MIFLINFGMIKFASVDNHFLRVKILIITLSAMLHLYIIALSTVFIKTYKKAMVRKRRSQKEIPGPKTEVGKLSTYPKKAYRVEQLFPNRRPHSYPNLTKTMKTYTRFKQHSNCDQSLNSNNHLIPLD